MDQKHQQIAELAILSAEVVHGVDGVHVEPERWLNADEIEAMDSLETERPDLRKMRNDQRTRSAIRPMLSDEERAEMKRQAREDRDPTGSTVRKILGE